MLSTSLHILGIEDVVFWAQFPDAVFLQEAWVLGAFGEQAIFPCRDLLGARLEYLRGGVRDYKIKALAGAVHWLAQQTCACAGNQSGHWNPASCASTSLTGSQTPAQVRWWPSLLKLLIFQQSQILIECLLWTRHQVYKGTVCLKEFTI